MEERPNEKAPKDKINHKFVPPKLTVSDAESGTYSIIYNEMDSESERMSNSSAKESERGEEHSSSLRKTQYHPDLQKAVGDLTNNNRSEGMQDKVKTNEEGRRSWQAKQIQRSKSLCERLLKWTSGFSSSERVKTVDELEEELSETLSSESFKPDKSERTYSRIWYPWTVLTPYPR